VTGKSAQELLADARRDLAEVRELLGLTMAMWNETCDSIVSGKEPTNKRLRTVIEENRRLTCELAGVRAGMAKTLDQASIDELQAEIDRRKRAQDIPEPHDFQATDWLPLYRMVIQHVRSVADGTPDEDIGHEIYESALTCVFGDEVWDWFDGLDG